MISENQIFTINAKSHKIAKFTPTQKIRVLPLYMLNHNKQTNRTELGQMPLQISHQRQDKTSHLTQIPTH